VSPTWYDVLDVDATATAEEVRASWQRLVAELGPTDRRFRVVNEAAEVLLDPARRAAYDAELAETEAPVEMITVPVVDTVAEPVAPVTIRKPAVAVAAVAEDEPPTSLELQHIDVDRTPQGGIPGWLLIGVALVTAAALVATGLIWRDRSPNTDVEGGARSAQSAAERAIVPILSYDYRHMDRSQAAAQPYMTSDYRKKYDQIMAALKQSAASTRTKVGAEVLASGIVRSGPDRVAILLFVDQPRTNKQHKTPDFFRNQVTAYLNLVDGDWLVDCLVTTPEGTCN
jgi:Mce-associated membrane protein